MNKATFVELAKQKYGDAFDYAYLPESIARAAEVIVCRKHGKIEMIPRDHLRSRYGCPHCASEKVRKSPLAYSKETIKKANAKYDHKFDYSGVDLNTEKGGKVQIACPDHGPFQMSLHRHLHGEHGCPECAKVEVTRQTTKYTDVEAVAARAREVHGDVYEYTDYDPETRTIVYICPRHGETKQLLRSHMTGRGCNGCGYANRTITPEEFLARAKVVHPEGYTYDLTELTTVNHKITIRHECGHEYQGRVSNHLSGQGCVRCKVSLGEEKIAQFLTEHGLDHTPQYRVGDYLYRYDFFVPDLNLLIEYDGEQHFRPVKYFGGVETYERLVQRDREKNLLAKMFGHHLIRIPYTQFDNLEVYLSRAIDRYFRYRVDNTFYRNFTDICTSLDLPGETTARSLEPYRTFRALSPPTQ